MPYSVNNTDSSLNFTVQDGAVDNSTLSISLIGTNAENYADDIARNDVHLLENFASISAPTAGTVLTGQLWYDKTDNVLRVYKGTTGGWVNLEPLVVGTAPTRLTPRIGERYFDTSNNKFYIYDGAQWRPTGYAGEETSALSGDSLVHNPTKFGAKVRAIFLKDTSGRVHPCMALVYVNNSTTNELYGSGTNGETIMALFNHDATFTADNVVSETEGDNINYYAELNSTGGIGIIINKGMNLRDDYVSEAVSLATEAVTAQKANALQVGGVVINASDFARKSDDIIPTADKTYSLGSSGVRYDHLFVQQITVGDGQEQIQFASANAAKIGSSSKRALELYTNLVDASTNVNVGQILTVTGNSNLTGNVDVTNNLQVNQNIRSNATVFGSTLTDNTLQINSGSITGAVNGTFSGTVQYGSLSDGAITITSFVDEDNMASDSAVRVPTQQSTKAYVDTANANMKTYVDLKNSQQDLDITTDSGNKDILVDSEVLTLAGGSGIDSSASGTTVTMALDNTVARTNIDETFDANLIVTGNLTVSGTTTTVNSATLNVADNEITLNSDVAGAPSQNAGIEVERGSSTNVKVRWNESTDKWQFTNDGSTYYNIPASTSDLAEGTNLYFTNARADARADVRIAAADTGDLSEGSNLYYTDARVLTKIQATTLTNLSDVNYGTPTNNQALIWNGSNSRWQATTLPSGVTELVNLNDVNGGTGASTGQVLQKLANGEFGFGSVSTANNYADSLAFATGTGILTVGRNGLSDLTVDLDGRYSTTDTQYSVATNSALGLIKIGYTDNAKNYAVELDGDNEAYVNVPWTDTVYSLPLAASGTRGGVKIGYTENGKNYPVELSSEKMYVNVPWTDTNDNTVYTAGSGITKNTAGSAAGAFSHADTSSVSNLTASGRTYITGMTFDTYGHVTGYSTGTETDQSFSDTNYYVNAMSFNTGNGVLTLTRSDGGTVTEDLDGRYSTTDTNTTYSAGEGLQLSGTTFSMDGAYNGTFRVGSSSSHDISSTGDVIAYYSSDINLKENILPIENALEKLCKIRGVTFDWKDEYLETRDPDLHQKRDTGIIAQEVQEVLPEVVKEKVDGTLGVRYEKMIGLLVESIKDLKAEVDDLKKQLNEK